MPFFLFEEKMLNSICTNYVIFAYHDVVDFRDFRLYHQCLIFGETAVEPKLGLLKLINLIRYVIHLVLVSTNRDRNMYRI